MLYHHQPQHNHHFPTHFTNSTTHRHMTKQSHDSKQLSIILSTHVTQMLTQPHFRLVWNNIYSLNLSIYQANWIPSHSQHKPNTQFSIKSHALQQNQYEQSLSSITIHTRAYRNHGHILGTPKILKMAKNSIIVFVPPDGSSSTARRFIASTQKLGLVLVSPGGHAWPARWFLEKIPETRFHLWFSCKLSSQPRMLHDSIKNKSQQHQTHNRNSPNLDFP